MIIARYDTDRLKSKYPGCTVWNARASSTPHAPQMTPDATNTRAFAAEMFTPITAAPSGLSRSAWSARPGLLRRRLRAYSHVRTRHTATRYQRLLTVMNV